MARTLARGVSRSVRGLWHIGKSGSSGRRPWGALAVGCLAYAAAAAPTAPAHAASPSIVISQVYGGGGNSGAAYTNDFVELFNRGTTTVSLSGWSIQYASATGSGSFGATSASLTPLGGSLAPGQYMLIEEASTGATGSALPAPDVTDATPISMSAVSGKVALASTSVSLGCNGGTTPCSASALANIVDLVGYGSADFYEGASAAPSLTNATAAFRVSDGCVDRDENGADFVADTPAPRNTASPTHPCAALGSDGMVISQVYGGGGNSGAPYDQDFVELFNRGDATVDVTGWSIQYASATGTGTFGSASNLITPLAGTVAPGQYLLVHEASGGGASTPLPAADVTDASPIALSATSGKVALVSTTTPLGCNGGSTPCSAADLAAVVDLVGYGSANFFEGLGPAPTLSNESAALRAENGCVDTDDNGADFAAGDPTPRNSASIFNRCDNATPTADAGGPYEVTEGGAVSLAGTGADADEETLDYAWDLDNNGSFETAGASPLFDAGSLDGPATFTVVLRVCDPSDACATDTTTVEVLNVAPVVDAGDPGAITSGDSFDLAATFTDAGVPDTHTATVDWGDGSAIEAAAVVEDGGSGQATGSHAYFAPGDYTVTVCVLDDDGDSGCDDTVITVTALQVAIDVKPGSAPNPINLRARGNVPVGILSGWYGTVEVTAGHIVVDSLAFAGAPALTIGGSSDVNGDGAPDLVAHFATQALELGPADTEACLSGRLDSGIYFAGCDTVRILP